MDKIKMAPHEMLKIHELLTLKNLSLTKTVTMLPLVKDTELKEIMQGEIDITQKHVEDLKNIINRNLLNN